MAIQRTVRRTLWIVFALAITIILVLLPRIWSDLVYPLRYENLIIQSAAEFNIPPTLLAGLIFTESRFNERATSHVGARGLTQIMPATGAGIASRLGDTDYTADKLYEPATAIRYGAYYVRNLLDRYGNDVDVALAGYNGGPGVATRYQADRNASIPAETAGFIIKVKRHRDIYRDLYGEGLITGSDISGQIRQTEPPTLWENVFGWLFN